MKKKKKRGGPQIAYPAHPPRPQEQLISAERITTIRGMRVVLPERVARRPRDVRGYPILYTSYIRPDGTPDFTTNDPNRAVECMLNELCGICGEKIQWGDGPDHDCYPFHFVGGPISIEETRVFNDPAMHKECVEFAMTVCPWMIMARYIRPKYDETIVADANMALQVMERPPYMGLLAAVGYQPNPQAQLCKASVHNKVLRRWNPRADEPFPTEEELARYRLDAFKALFLQGYDQIKAQYERKRAAKFQLLSLMHIEGQLERGEIDEQEATTLKKFITEGRTKQ